MKIAMMTNNYKPFVGGVPISIERLSKGLRERGHEVWIFAPEYDNVDEKEDRENRVIRYQSWRGIMENGAVIPNIFDYRIREEFEMGQFDLIHVHHPMLLGNVAAHYSKKYGIPLVFTYHTKYEEYLHYIDTVSGFQNEKITDEVCRQGKKVIPWYMKKYLKRCSMVFAPSKDMHRYVEKLGVETPIQVLPTGLTGEAYEWDLAVTARLKEKLLDGKKYLLCTVSRLEKEKNQYFLIDAVKKLKDQMGDDFRFVFVGDGNERKSLEAYSEALGLSDTILFAGCVPNKEVTNYLSASDGFLFSSKSETQGIVILEAMAAGLPVIALDATGVRDIVEDGKNGFLLKEDVDDYVARLRDILQDEALKNRFSKNARETSLFYHNSSIAQRAEAFYGKVLEEKRRENYGEYTCCRG